MKYSSKEIQKFAEENMEVRINLHLRNPVYGKIVILADHDHLMSKGMIRFVMNERLHSFNEAQTDFRKCEFTKIMAIKEITYIKQF